MDAETLPTESHPGAAEILRAAGWAPHPTWGVFTRGPLVMGVFCGNLHIKNTAMAPDSPDTPDDPVDAARWLVARFAVAEPSEAAEYAGHEAHEETGADSAIESGEAELPGDVPASLHEGGERVADGTDAERGGGPIKRTGALDQEWANASTGNGPNLEYADFTETDDLSPLETDLPEPDLGAEILLDDYGDGADPLLTYTEAEGEEAIAEPEHAAGAFIFGDNLHQMRTAAIGLVVQISLAKQDAIWEVSGTTEAAYEHLVSQVMRDTRDGMYIGPPEAFTKFTELQQWANRAASVKKAERLRVALLLNASREEIEMFDPEADWP